MQVYMGGTAPTYSVDWKKNSCMAIFLAGCDYNCPGCSTPELIEFKEDYIVNFLDLIIMSEGWLDSSIIEE